MEYPLCATLRGMKFMYDHRLEIVTTVTVVLILMVIFWD